MINYLYTKRCKMLSFPMPLRTSKLEKTTCDERKFKLNSECKLVILRNPAYAQTGDADAHLSRG